MLLYRTVSLKFRTIRVIITCSRFSDNRDDEKVYAKKEAAVLAGKKREFPLVLFSSSRLLNFANPNISEPGTG